MTTIYKCDPKTTIIKAEVLDATEILISYRDGESPRKEYTLNEVCLHEKSIIVDTNCAKNECINTNYIIKTTPVRLAHVVTKYDGIIVPEDVYCCFGRDEVIVFSEDVDVNQPHREWMSFDVPLTKR